MIELDVFRHFLIVFGISIIRLTAACSVVPFMSTQLVQARVRNSLIFSWGLIVYPIVAPTIGQEVGSTLTILVIVVKEIVIGILIGFMASKMFWVALSVGYFIDNQRGASMASVYDPTSGEQTSPFGLFLQQTLIVLFYSSGGFLVFLGGVFQSYLIWPINSFFPQFSDAFPGFFLEVADDLMMVAVVLAAPVVITVFVTEFGLGLMNRFAPQLNVFVLAMPIKSLVGMIVLVIYLPMLLTMFHDDVKETERVYDLLNQLFVGANQ
ncbi:EscT/YscT/HrcT family type III secretion system export apparatus protein [bacterium]|nr:EscT/YscT/HrcT family type III secretion system export apparatus protein [bacterium]